MVSSEVETLARTGGLGDVVNQLSRALAAAGNDIRIVTPRYGNSVVPAGAKRWATPVRVPLGGVGTFDVSVLEAPLGSEAGPRVLLLDVPELYGRDGIYGDAHGAFGDNDLRFALMSRAALAVAERAWNVHGGCEKVVLHAHDWHAAPSILYARGAASPMWSKARTVFTIHNLAFQGELTLERARQLGFSDIHFSSYVLEHLGKANLMKGATALADCVTTVSRNYAKEILTDDFAFGLGLHLRAHADKLTGIENGIDAESFDPRTDRVIACNYDSHDVAAGKSANKHALMTDLGLDAGEDAPVVANISRLTWQKGIDLVLPHVSRMVEQGARLVFVGQGDAPLEDALRALETRFPRRVAVRITFDATLARRVYAGSDFVVVPSRFEPCGLVQMYAMRYGAIPIVTAVGGLRDTVLEDANVGTGLVAPHPSEQDVGAALDRALAMEQDVTRLVRTRLRAMARDSSWTAPAEAYARLYAGHR